MSLVSVFEPRKVRCRRTEWGPLRAPPKAMSESIAEAVRLVHESHEQGDQDIIDAAFNNAAQLLAPLENTVTDFNPMSPLDDLLTFKVVRREDASGTSGIGVVAKGVLFPDGTTVVQWQTHVRSVVVYNSYADALHIHGHGDLTGFCFDARPDRLYLSSGEYVFL